MMFTLFLILLQVCLSLSDVLQIRMPGVRIPLDDTYYHMKMKVEEPMYITGYTALANSSVAHHMLLYGCEKVRDTDTWIGDMPCLEGSKILWAWALDAPDFIMPGNVSALAGGKTVPYLVLEVHYKLKRPEDYLDHSGINITFTRQETRYDAGIYLFMGTSNKVFPTGQLYDYDVGCNYTAPEINVFAYRTHAHDYAYKISGYKVHNGTWQELGSRDPRKPEMFVQKDVISVVLPGDTLYARCQYDLRDTNRTVKIGSTHHDEMCNMYLMYYVDRTKKVQIPDGCSTMTTFVLPKKTWYDKAISGKFTVYYVFILLAVVLLLGPMFYGVRVCCCNHNNRYKRPNDGFEKLFGPDDDEEEDDILYKSYKHKFAEYS